MVNHRFTQARTEFALLPLSYAIPEQFLGCLLPISAALSRCAAWKRCPSRSHQGRMLCMSEQDSPSPEVFVLQVDGRTLSVEPSAVVATPTPERYTYRLHSDERRYVLGPRKLHLWIVFLIVAVPGATLLAVALWFDEWRCALLGFGLAAFGGHLLISYLPPRFSFDLDRRQVVMSRRLLRRTWPLEQVLAVQVCTGPMQRIRPAARNPRPTWSVPKDRSVAWKDPDGTLNWMPYQLNLICDDERMSRLTIAYHADRVWIRAIGTELAQFLRVPLIDQMRTL